jgi:acetoin utilization deacetylase AcuC-like enzyme
MKEGPFVDDDGRGPVLITDPVMLAHDTGGGEHPETPQRLTAIRRRMEKLREVSPQRADWKRVLEAHEESYLLRFEEAALSGRPSLDHSDNRLSYETFEASFTAAGAGISGVDLLESGAARFPFCAVRPPGHHAEKDRAMGFCFLNNSVIAARYWRREYGRRKILIFDFDAHHGNGIQQAFEEEAEVLYVSFHEHPTFSYPGSGFAEDRGKGAGEGATVNIPLPPGAGEAAFQSRLREVAEPAVESFRPEAIVVSAGFDGHVKDDMSGLAYGRSLFRRIGETVSRWSRDYCGGRVLSILEGGYHCEALGESVEAYLEGMASPRGGV